MSYSNDTPASSNQFRGTGTGERSVPTTKASNQEKVTVDGKLKTTQNWYDKTLLPATNKDPFLDGFQCSGVTRKSPARNVGQGKT